MKSNLLLYSLYYAEVCNEFARPISASLRPGNTVSFEVMSQRWRAVGNTVSDLTGPRFEPTTSPLQRQTRFRLNNGPVSNPYLLFCDVGVWCNCVYVCRTGIYVLRTYFCGRTFLKNYLCGRTESHQKTFQTFPFCVTSWQNMEAISRCNCIHLFKRILNYCGKILRSISLLNRMSHFMLILGYLHPFTYDSVTTETEDLLIFNQISARKQYLKRHRIQNFGWTYKMCRNTEA